MRGRGANATGVVSYSWKLYRAGAAVAAPASVPLDRPSLVLPPFALPGGVLYTFELTTVVGDGRRGVASVELRLRRPPHGGGFLVTPQNGTVGETSFSLRADG